MLLSTVAAPVCIPTDSARGFPLYFLKGWTGSLQVQQRPLFTLGAPVRGCSLEGVGKSRARGRNTLAEAE